MSKRVCELVPSRKQESSTGSSRQQEKRCQTVMQMQLVDSEQASEREWQQHWRARVRAASSESVRENVSVDERAVSECVTEQ